MEWRGLFLLTADRTRRVKRFIPAHCWYDNEEDLNRQCLLTISGINNGSHLSSRTWHYSLGSPNHSDQGLTSLLFSFLYINQALYKGKESNFYGVPTLEDKDVSGILDQWLAASKRQLTANQRQVVLDAFKECPLPIFLKRSFDAACKWRSYFTPADTVLQVDEQKLRIGLFSVCYSSPRYKRKYTHTQKRIWWFDECWLKSELWGNWKMLSFCTEFPSCVYADYILLFKCYLCSQKDIMFLLTWLGVLWINMVALKMVATVFPAPSACRPNWSKCCHHFIIALSFCFCSPNAFLFVCFLQTTVRDSINVMFADLEKMHGQMLVSRALGYLTISGY